MANIIAFEELKLNNTFDGIACIKSASIQKTKNGSDYVSGTAIGGKTTIQFKIWDSTVVALLKPFIEAPTGFKTHLAKVTGNVGQYNGSLDYTFTSVTLIPDTPELSVRNFLPSLDCDALYNELCEFINNKLSPGFVNLLIAVMKLPANGDVTSQGTIQEAIKTCWAAASNHDAIQGGLIHHTIKMLRYAETLVANNPFYADYKDLIYTGIILHDIGKTKELSKFPRNDYTEEGQFIGHIIIGVQMIDEKLREIPDFPVLLANEVRHCILAHHGELEYGSPKKPAIAEALALNFADNTDAKLEIFKETLAAGQSDAGWIGYQNLLESNIRRTEL